VASIQLAPPHLTGVRALWHSTIGKKAVVAVTGLIMLVFLLLHMLGNLKIFFGPSDFDNYAGWLRRIGEPVLHGAWYLWIQRAVLFVALVLHIVASAQLSWRDLRARPVKYNGRQRFEATVTTRYMRTGGIVLGLFILWHLLNLSGGNAVPHYVEGHVYENVVQNFSNWYENVIYIVAMLALGLHIHHGFESSTRTLGFHRPTRAKAIKLIGDILAVAIAGGFIVVPVAVMAGLVD
jgi:succinate dehydrogenase / fumarate reductase, cytochrome b subunit